MKKAALLVIVLSILLFQSCATSSSHTCREILDKIIESEVGLPAGRIYSLTSSEESDEYLSSSLILALYGGEALSDISSGWIDCAIFLPYSSHPCEFAVFLCRDSDIATDTARLLCSRLDKIRVAKDSEQYSAMLRDAAVTVKGNYVFLIISSDSENAIRQASKMMRRY